MCRCQELPRGSPGPVEILPRGHLRSGSCLRTEQGDLRGVPQMNLLSQMSTLVQTLQAPAGLFLQPWRWLSSWVISSKQVCASVAFVSRTSHLTPASAGPTPAGPAFSSAPTGAQHLEEVAPSRSDSPSLESRAVPKSPGMGAKPAYRGCYQRPQDTGGPETLPGPQAAAGAANTAAFFLCEALLGQHFDVVPNGMAEPQPGDLFLFPLTSGVPGWWGAHAGVYCGDGEIIHLEGSSGTSPSGIVAKHGKSHLLRTRGPAKVLRRKGGLDAAALQRRVRAAMQQAVEYDLGTCNCIHFALSLLGLGQLAGAMVSPALQ